MPEILSKDIIERFMNSDRDAFNEIFNAYYESVFKQMSFKARDYDLACDITQDAFVKCWETRAKVNPEKSLYYYIVTIASNLLMNHFNHQSMKVKHHELIKHQHSGSGGSADSKLEFKELQQEIDRIVNKFLPKQCQLIFTMSRYEGKNNGEIAEALNITKKTVENQLYTALKVIRSKVKLVNVA